MVILSLMVSLVPALAAHPLGVRVAEVDFTEGFHFEDTPMPPIEKSAQTVPRVSPVYLAIGLAVLAAIVGLIVMCWNELKRRQDESGIGSYGGAFWITIVGLCCAGLLALAHPTVAILTAIAAISLASWLNYREGNNDLFLACGTPFLVFAALFYVLFAPSNRSVRRFSSRSRVHKPHRYKQQRIKVPRPLKMKKMKVFKPPKVKATKQPPSIRITNVGKKGTSFTYKFKSGNHTYTTTTGKMGPRYTSSNRAGNTTVTTVSTPKGVRTYRTRTFRSGNHITRERF
jgi:membrane protein implicated in regulation of membrane protease activity